MAHDVSLAAMFYLNFLRPKTMFLSPIPVCLYSITVSDFHSVSVPETSQSAEKTWWWLTWWPTKKEKRQTWSWTWWPTWWLVTGVGYLGPNFFDPKLTRHAHLLTFASLFYHATEALFLVNTFGCTYLLG